MLRTGGTSGGRSKQEEEEERLGLCYVRSYMRVLLFCEVRFIAT